MPASERREAFGSTMIVAAASPYITDYEFIDNKGYLGGVVTNLDLAAPIFNRCYFSGNQAAGVSVMLNLYESTGIMTNSLIEANVNQGVDQPQLLIPMLSTFYNNAALMNTNNSKARLINTTIVNSTNSGTSTGDEAALIANIDGSTTYLTNSILWGNAVNGIFDDGSTGPSKVSYSLIQGSPADPLRHMQDGTGQQPFIDPDHGNFQIKTPSPLINAGMGDSLVLALAAYLPGGASAGLDLLGNTRITETAIDLGAYEYAGGPLPITLTKFTASYQSGMANLDWVSGVEDDHLNRYVIERSLNGQDFQKIATVKATGSNSTYRYTTPQAVSTAYYRLKGVHTNGDVDYSATKKVVSAAGSQPAQLYPNPAHNFINVQVRASGRLLIYTADGRLVKTVSLKSGVNKVNVSQLSAGMYYGLLDGQKVSFVKH